MKDALLEKKYSYIGTASRFDKVLEILKDPDSSFNFAGAFNKCRSRFTEYTSPAEVIEDLETLPQEDTLNLLDTIIQVAEEENYNWSSSPEEVINWLKDVRTGNNLYAIILMWDEFTEYFKNTGSAAKIFEEFMAKWNQAKDYSEKMILIDTLLHQFHLSFVAGTVNRPVAMNFMDGTRRQVEGIVNELAGNPLS